MTTDSNKKKLFKEITDITEIITLAKGSKLVNGRKILPGLNAKTKPKNYLIMHT